MNEMINSDEQKQDKEWNQENQVKNNKPWNLPIRSLLFGARIISSPLWCFHCNPS